MTQKSFAFKNCHCYILNKRAFIIIVIINVAFWIVSNLLQTEHILSNASYQQSPLDSPNVIQFKNPAKIMQDNEQIKYKFIVNEQSILSINKSIVFICGISTFVGYHTTLKLISMNIKVIG
eukprot:256932_1